MTGLQEANRFWGPQITLNFEPSAIPTWMWAESRTGTILIAFKEAIRNGVPVMAHGSCRASQFSQLEANRRNLLNSFTLWKGLLVFPKVTWAGCPTFLSFRNWHVQRQKFSRGREQIGVHTCDRRSSRTDYVEHFPKVDVSHVKHDEEQGVLYANGVQPWVVGIFLVSTWSRKSRKEYTFKKGIHLSDWLSAICCELWTEFFLVWKI